MPQVGSLIIDLVAGQARLEAGMKQATKTVQTSMKNIDGTINATKNLLGTLGVTLSAAFAVSRINSALQFADSLSELARRTGLTTRATQELQFAFIQSGSSAEGYNTVMGKFVQTLGDAANGSREAVEALKRVGITQEDLRRQTPEELYLRTSDALSKMSSATERASIANDLFGKSYKDSANAINLSRKELEELRQQANVTGAVLDAQVIQNAKKAKDEMEAWGRVINVQLTEAFVGFAPILVRSAKFLADFANMAKGALQSMGLIERTTLGDQRDKLLSQWANVNSRLRSVESGLLSWTTINKEKEIAALKDRRAAIEKELDANTALFQKQSALRAKGGDTGEAAPGPAATRIKAFEDPADKKFEDLNARLRGRLETLQVSFLTEQEQQRAHLVAQQQIIQEAYAFEQISFAERNLLLEEANLQHQAKMGDISAQGALKRRNFDQQTLRQQASTVFGELAGITAGVATHNKKLFQINKIAGIANATIAAYEGASNSLKSYPWPLAGIMAAVHLAAGLANVKAISSASFGGTTSAPSIGAGGATPVTDVGSSAPPAFNQPSGGSAREVKVAIEFHGAPPPDGWVRDSFLPVLERALADGAGSGGAAATFAV